MTERMKTWKQKTKMTTINKEDNMDGVPKWFLITAAACGILYAAYAIIYLHLPFTQVEKEEIQAVEGMMDLLSEVSGR